MGKNIIACSRVGGDCWNCIYADQCPRWNDTALDVPIISTLSGDVVGFTSPTDPDYNN